MILILWFAVERGFWKSLEIANKQIELNSIS